MRMLYESVDGLRSSSDARSTVPNSSVGGHEYSVNNPIRGRHIVRVYLETRVISAVASSIDRFASRACCQVWSVHKRSTAGPLGCVCVGGAWLSVPIILRAVAETDDRCADAYFLSSIWGGWYK
jgi:hypothetical protein